MTSFIISPGGFFALLSLFAAGAIGPLILTGSDERANRCGAGFAVIGSLWGLCFSGFAILSKKALSFSFAAGPFPLFRPSFHIDMTSAFFIFVISLITLLSSVYGFSYVKHYYKKFSIGALGFFYNVFVLGMLVAVAADNALWFLVAWEIMSLSSYFLVIYERDKPENIKAGFLYLVMTHVATAFIVLAFLLLHTSTGSFDFGVLRAGAGLVPRSLKNAVFILAMVGFGTKAGTVPFHVWLPGAHPAAPAHVSALMSGVMIKMGIYMMIRLFFGPSPACSLMVGAGSARGRGRIVAFRGALRPDRTRFKKTFGLPQHRKYRDHSARRRRVHEFSLARDARAFASGAGCGALPYAEPRDLQVAAVFKRRLGHEHDPYRQHGKIRRPHKNHAPNGAVLFNRVHGHFSLTAF